MADVSVTWLGHASFRVDSPEGKRIYVDPWLGNPKCPDSEKEPERIDVIAITHGHGDHVGETVELSKQFKPQAVVANVELKAWLRAAGRGDGRPAGLEQGRHGRGRRDQGHARERLPLERLGRRRLPRRGRRDRARARERHDALLRRRHLRLRRHAADRAHLLARRGDPADRRPLHDGPARGRGRARAARGRSAASRATTAPSRCCTSTPDELREQAPSGVEIIELQPGETTTV